MADNAALLEISGEAVRAAYFRGDWSIFDANAHNAEFMEITTERIALITRDMEALVARRKLMFKHFTLFPQLPIEIRLKIWKHALPGLETNSHRILRVNVEVLRDLQKIGLRLRFTLSKKKWEGWLKTSPGALDLGLSMACKESRGIFLEAFKYTLPTCKRGVIMRYNEDTTIYIENFHIALRHPLFKKVLRHNPSLPLPLPPYFSQIKKLILPRACFYSVSQFNVRDGRHTYANLFAPMFKNLELIGVEYHRKWHALLEIFQLKAVERVKENLEGPEDEVDKVYNVPGVVLIKPEWTYT